MNIIYKTHTPRAKYGEGVVGGVVGFNFFLIYRNLCNNFKVQILIQHVISVEEVHAENKNLRHRHFRVKHQVHVISTTEVTVSMEGNAISYDMA